MRYTLSADTGGLVNIWLNLAKLLIGLVFAYQQVLTQQLGINILRLTIEVLRLGSYDFGAAGRESGQASNNQSGQNNNTTFNGQIIMRPNYSFVIPFVPLSRMKYEKGVVEITGVFHPNDSEATWKRVWAPTQSATGFPADPNTTREFPYPKRTAAANPIVVKGFNLDKMLGSSLNEGKYRAVYKVSFYSSAEKLLGSWPSPQEDCIQNGQPTIDQPSQNSCINFIDLSCVTPPPPVQERYGDLSLMEARFVDFPQNLVKRLNGKSLLNKYPGNKNNSSRRFQERLKGKKEGETGMLWVREGQTLINGSDTWIWINNDKKRFEAIDIEYSPSGNNNYELIANYKDEDGGKPHDLIISFMVQKNMPPRPIYAVKPGTEPQVQIYYDDDMYETGSDGGYEFVMMEKFIVDPDGVDSLIPQRMEIVKEGEDYQHYDLAQSNGWRLKITDSKMAYRRQLKAKGTHKLSLRVTDDFTPKVFSVWITWRGTK